MSQRATGYSGINTSANPALPLWIRIIVVVGALLLACGGVIALARPAMLVSPRDEITEAVRIYAGYLASRNLTLALMLVTAMTLRARAALSSLMLLVAFIQAVDAVIDGTECRWPIVPGVLIFGLLFFLGAARVSGYPFWRAEAWSRTR